MLKKLLKYEFKATARTYGGMYLALLAASVLFGGSVRRWNSTNSEAYSTLVGLLSLVYTAVIIGTVVVTIMTIVQRFYRNLLGREGYLMHTLPVTETQLVTSKLISSTVWSLCSILAACLSFGILAVLMMADMDLLEQLPRMWSIIREAFARYNMEFWGALAFSGVVGFVRMVSVIACIYAACMVGHQFKNHPRAGGHPELLCHAVCAGLARKAAPDRHRRLRDGYLQRRRRCGQHRDCRLGSGLHGERDGHAGHRGGIRRLLVRADGLADAKQTQPRVMKREKI